MRTARGLVASKQGESHTIQLFSEEHCYLTSNVSSKVFVLENALDGTQIQTAVSLVNGLLKETTQSRYKTHTATASTRT